jgi:putative transposase
MESAVSLTELSETQRQQALERFQLLRPFLEEDVPLTQIAQKEGLNLRTLQRWVTRYRLYGLGGLLRKSRADSGCHRRLSSQLQLLVEGLALRKPPPRITAIHRKVVEAAQKLGETPPSYDVVYAVVQELDPALVTLAQEGEKAYRETYDLLYRREAQRPNAIWQADHTLLDIWVKNEQREPARPWLTVIEDDYSRAIAGYFLSFSTPSALHTALALHQAIWRKQEAHWHVCGIPEVLYVDHGSDFTSRHLEQVGADLKMRLIFSQKGIPRGRGKIERFFETVNQQVLCHLPGYTPEQSSPPVPTLTLSDLEGHLRRFLLEGYHLAPHSTTGVAPQARWEAGGFLPQMPESLEQLDLLLLTVARPRRVQQDGIRFEGLRYIDTTLAAYVGEDVVVRYDPRDMAEIRVYHHNRFLCRAICQEVAGQTLSLKEIVRARRERHKQLRGQLSDRAAVIEALLQVHQSPPPLVAPATATEEAPKVKLKRYYNE